MYRVFQDTVSSDHPEKGVKTVMDRRIRTSCKFLALMAVTKHAIASVSMSPVGLAIIEGNLKCFETTGQAVTLQSDRKRSALAPRAMIHVHSRTIIQISLVVSNGISTMKDFFSKKFAKKVQNNKASAACLVHRPSNKFQALYPR